MDLSRVASDFRKEIVRAGDAYIDGQVRIAASADARAAGLTGMFIAAATALTVGVVIALMNPAWTNAPRGPIIWAGAIAAITFLIGAGCCLQRLGLLGFFCPAVSRTIGWRM